MYKRYSINNLIFSGLCVVKTAFLVYFWKSGVKIFCI